MGLSGIPSPSPTPPSPIGLHLELELVKRVEQEGQLEEEAVRQAVWVALGEFSHGVRVVAKEHSLLPLLDKWTLKLQVPLPPATVGIAIYEAKLARMVGMEVSGGYVVEEWVRISCEEESLAEKILPSFMHGILRDKHAERGGIEIALTGWEPCQRIATQLGLSLTPRFRRGGRCDYSIDAWDTLFWLANDAEDVQGEGEEAEEGEGELGANAAATSRGRVRWDSAALCAYSPRTGEVLARLGNWGLLEEVCGALGGGTNVYFPGHWTTLDLQGEYQGEFCLWDHVEQRLRTAPSQEELVIRARQTRLRNADADLPAARIERKPSANDLGALEGSPGGREALVLPAGTSDQASRPPSLVPSLVHGVELTPAEMAIDTENPRAQEWIKVFEANVAFRALSPVDHENLDAARLKAIVVTFDPDARLDLNGALVVKGVRHKTAFVRWATHCTADLDEATLAKTISRALVAYDTPSLPEHRWQELREAFLFFDQDDSGFLSVDEFEFFIVGLIAGEGQEELMSPEDIEAEFLDATCGAEVMSRADFRYWASHAFGGGREEEFRVTLEDIQLEAKLSLSKGLLSEETAQVIDRIYEAHTAPSSGHGIDASTFLRVLRCVEPDAELEEADRVVSLHGGTHLNRKHFFDWVIGFGSKMRDWFGWQDTTLKIHLQRCIAPIEFDRERWSSYRQVFLFFDADDSGSMELGEFEHVITSMDEASGRQVMREDRRISTDSIRDEFLQATDGRSGMLRSDFYQWGLSSALQDLNEIDFASFLEDVLSKAKQITFKQTKVRVNQIDRVFDAYLERKTSLIYSAALLTVMQAMDIEATIQEAQRALQNAAEETTSRCASTSTAETQAGLCLNRKQFFVWLLRYDPAMTMEEHDWQEWAETCVPLTREQLRQQATATRAGSTRRKNSRLPHRDAGVPGVHK